MKKYPDNAEGMSIKASAFCFPGAPAKSLILTFLLLCASLSPAQAQQTNELLTLTLDEALQIAYVNSYIVKDARIGVEVARAQVKEGRGQLYPQVDINSSYTRNIKQPNPFSGSSASNLFSSLGFIDWLAFNEQARTDVDAMTEPLSFVDFALRQQQGLNEAGIVPNLSDNPFAVPNVFQSGITVSQKLLDFSAFIAVKGASKFVQASSELALERQEQLLIDNVRASFYQALLVSEQAQVAEQSVSRTAETLQELGKQVSLGVAPKFQRLSAEVELANLETSFLQRKNAEQTALDQLKMTLGIPIDQPIRLAGALEAKNRGAYMTISTDDAVILALERRPDLEQIKLNIELQNINARVTRTGYLPTISAFANYSYVGNVPSNRSFILTDPNDPFRFSQGSNSYFSSNYWDQAFNAGFQLNWRLFDGFQNKSRAQQQKLAADRAQVQYDQQLQGIRQEVAIALRNLEASRLQILSQERNVERADLNYTFAQKRLQEGMSSPLEERNASEQLDQSKLNYLQAVHDFLRAQSAFETAVGMPLAKPENFKLASR
ncbi:MAG: TolC family protein [Rhodothermales bacterium]